MVGDQELNWPLEQRGDAREAPIPAAEPLLGPPSLAWDGGVDIELPFDAAGWTDELTGCDGPRLWDRDLTSEQERNVRHKRTATIALVELAGIELAAGRWGRDLAEQLFLRLAKVITSGIRLSDHIARIGPTRFGVLLVETDEILAINFVDRVRTRCASDIDPEVHGFRIGIGWANPGPGEQLADAQRVAAERLEADLSRQA